MQKKIVIIEDNVNLSDTLRLALELEGYQVASFPELEAVDTMLAMQVSCFILDENLPVVSGHIICMMLRAAEHTKHTPVILISADPAVESLAALSESDAFLQKPFDISALLGLLQRLIS